MSKALRPNLGWERRGASDHTELEAWTASPGGGLTVAIKHTINHLVQWGLNPGINITPASYTHRQILAGLKILGAKRLLQIIIDEVKMQTEAGNGGVVLDVATAFVCAPDSASWDNNAIGTSSLDILPSVQALQRRMNLREALKYEVDNAPKLHKTDPIHAETLIRLYRKVEAQLILPQQQDILNHDALVTLDGSLAGGLDAGALDGAIADVSMGALGGDGMSGDTGTGLDGLDTLGGDMGVTVGEHDDFGSGLGGSDVIDSYFNAGELGDGMDF